MRSKAVLTLRGLSPKMDAWWWIEMNRIGLDWIFGGRKMFHALEPAAWWGPGYAAFLFEQGWFRRRGIAWGPNAKKEEPGLFLFWAVDEAWTRDLFLTKEVLYHWATTATFPVRVVQKYIRKMKRPKKCAFFTKNFYLYIRIITQTRWNAS